MMREWPDPGPCPNCGEPRGAVTLLSRWGHDHACCSDACGLEFADRAKRYELELDVALEELEAVKSRVKHLQNKVSERKAAERGTR